MGVLHALSHSSLRYRGGFIFGGEVKGQRYWRSARGWVGGGGKLKK